MPHSLRGSCLCGSVCYEASGELFGFYHCHCSRCCKATGTGHASNILLKPSRLAWKKGEELVSVFKVPEAKRFASWFCSKCGSSVPRYTAEFEFTVVPAGSLDEETSLEPECHIFYDSKPRWSCTGDKLPRFEKYPTK